MAAKVLKTFKALFAFEAQSTDELSLAAGDLIACTIVHPGEWGYGTSKTSGKSGSFPWSYVEEVPDTSGSGGGPPVPAEETPAVKAPEGPQAATTHQSSMKAKPEGYQNVPVGGYGAGGGSAVTTYDEVAGSAPATSYGMPDATPPAAVGGGGGGGGDSSSEEGQPWYAGGMDRGAAMREIMSHPDGTFLIRVSARHGGFSLSVKFSGDCRHIKIEKDSAGKYGFAVPGQFATIGELVEHFKTTSLNCYNAELETVLQYPYKTAPADTGGGGGGDEEVDEDIYGDLREALRHDRKKKGQDVLYYSSKVNDLHKARKGHDAVLKMLTESLKILESKLVEVSRDADVSAINANIGRIKGKINASETALKKVEKDLRVAQKAEDKSLAKGGGRAGGGGAAAAPVRSLAEIEAVPSDPSKSEFYTGLIRRDEAEAQLKGKSDGTYLVRKTTRESDPYTLSLRFLAKTKHIQIKYDGTRFGLADPLAFYSLEGLCEYYTTMTIAPSINTKLKAPIKAGR